MPGEMARSDPRPSVRVTRGVGSGQHLASVLQKGRENASIVACLGFIWRISANRRHKACRACAASGHAIEPPIVTMNCCRRMSDCEITSHGVTHMQRRDFTTVSGHVSSSYASN
jgi:hypothetical protein